MQAPQALKRVKTQRTFTKTASRFVTLAAAQPVDEALSDGSRVAQDDTQASTAAQTIDGEGTDAAAEAQALSDDSRAAQDEATGDADDVPCAFLPLSPRAPLISKHIDLVILALISPAVASRAQPHITAGS